MHFPSLPPPPPCPGDSAFASLLLLDLSHNKISKRSSVERLQSMPHIKKKLLHGNPWAVAVQLARKKERERAEMLQAMGAQAHAGPVIAEGWVDG